MADLVLLTLTVIKSILQAYEDFQALQEEAQQFRRILRTSRSILEDVVLQLQNNEHRVTSLRESMESLQSAVNDGGAVFEKCADRSSHVRLKQFMFSKKYLEKLAGAGNRIQSALGMLSAAGVAMHGDILDGLEKLQEQNRKLQQKAFEYHNEVLDQLQSQSAKTEAMPQKIVDELIKRGYVVNRQDFFKQMKELHKEAHELRADREKFNTNKAQVDEYILLADADMIQMVEQLSLNEANQKSNTSSFSASITQNKNEVDEILKCPISLDRVQDPVTLFPSGHTFDRESICGWLLTNPDRDPITMKRYDTPMSFADNISLRQILMQHHGDMAYVKYDDTAFQNEYLSIWKSSRPGNKETPIADGSIKLDNGKTSEKTSDQGQTEARNTKQEIYVHFEDASQPSSNIELYQKLFDLTASRVPSKVEEAFNLALTEHHDPVCLGVAASIIDPKNQKVEYPKKDALHANDLWQRAVHHGLSTLATKDGQPWAQLVEGLRYRFNLDNKSDALDWFRRVADDHNLATAQCYMSDMYLLGEGVNQSFSLAAEWLRRAADQGNAVAQGNLGFMYENGHGVAQSYALAKELYQSAADKGFAPAEFSLGTIYDNGHGVTKNDATAIEWYCRAADQGHVNAQFKLGSLYEKGHGVTQDMSTAVDWYCKAATSGYVEAQSRLGAMYYTGTDAIQNYETAFGWYRLAADQGCASAQYHLGYMFRHGIGVTQNYALAVEWYQHAASQGNADGQFNLGTMYEHGLRVKQSNTKALEWYRRAADQGHVAAKGAITDLTKKNENKKGLFRSIKHIIKEQL
jgi:TPR repeat protein